MIEQSLMDRIFEAIEAGDWQLGVGSGLLVAIAIVRALTRDRLPEPASAWVSASAALLGGIGALLVAGSVWWQAVLIGALVMPSSSGLYRLISDAIGRASRISSLMALFIAASMVASGCGADQGRAQSIVRSSLVAADEGVAAADRVIAPIAAERSADVLDQIRDECGDPCPDALDRYRGAMAQWSRVADALRASHAGLAAADEGVEVWIASGDLPAHWPAMCHAAAAALDRFVELLEAVDAFDVPPALSGAPDLLMAGCDVAERWLERADQVSRK